MTACTSNRMLYFFGGANVSLDQMIRLALRIQSFCELEMGWHFGEGRCATEEAARNALDVLNYFHHCDTRSIEVFPEIEGSILVSGYHGQDTVDVLCRHDGSISLVHEVGDDEIEDNPSMSMNEVMAYLGDLSWATEKLSESFIPKISVMNSGNLRVLPSKILQAGESPSLMLSVPESVAEQNVSTYAIFTMGLEEKNQFYGESFRLRSPREVPLNRSHP